MSIEDIEKLMDRFYDLDSDVDDQVFAALRNFANDDRERFVEYVNSQKFGPNSYRPILYESIMDNAKGWEDFLLNQIKYIIEHVELGTKSASSAISSIYFLTNIDDLEPSFYSSVIEFLQPRLRSKNIVLRKAALEYIVDLHFEGKINMCQKIKRELQMQLKDQVYNVRLNAYLILKDENLLPMEFKQSIIDRIRAMTSSDYWIHVKTKAIAKKVAEGMMKNDF